MSAIPYGQKKNGRWAVLHDQCRHCTDRPHEAKGFCSNCYGYHRDKESARAKRKAKRLEKNTVAARYRKVRTWCEANAERVAESKRHSLLVVLQRGFATAAASRYVSMGSAANLLRVV